MNLFPFNGGRPRIAQRPPGTPVYVGQHDDVPVTMELFDYDPDRVVETTLATPDAAAPCRNTETVSWLNVTGVHDIDVVETIGNHFGIHPLAQEDIANTHQRPKVEDYDENLFVVLRMFRLDDAFPDSSTRATQTPPGEASPTNHEDRAARNGATSPAICSEQVSLVLGRHSVLSFQERPGDVFDTIRERLRTGRGRLRNMGSDYLLYALLDAVVDNYFVVMEELAARVEAAEEDVLDDPQPAAQRRLHALRKEIIGLRKSVWPLREAVSALEKGESDLIGRPTRLFLRDLYDHVIQLLDTMETLRDVISGLFDMYLSSVSNRMNEVMKVLTMIATLFIPITFIAGIYGMNFATMPELQWRWGYPAALTAMAVVAAGMLVYFKRKRWL